MSSTPNVVLVHGTVDHVKTSARHTVRTISVADAILMMVTTVVVHLRRHTCVDMIAVRIMIWLVTMTVVPARATVDHAVTSARHGMMITSRIVAISMTVAIVVDRLHHTCVGMNAVRITAWLVTMIVDPIARRRVDTVARNLAITNITSRIDAITTMIVATVMDRPRVTTVMMTVAHVIADSVRNTPIVDRTAMVIEVVPAAISVVRSRLIGLSARRHSCVSG